MKNFIRVVTRSIIICGSVRGPSVINGQIEVLFGVCDKRAGRLVLVNSLWE